MHLTPLFEEFKERLVVNAVEFRVSHERDFKVAR